MSQIFTTLMLIKSNIKRQRQTAISIYLFIHLEQLEAGLVILLILGWSCSHICVLTVHYSRGHSALLHVSFILQQTNWQKRKRGGQPNHSRASQASIYITFSNLTLVNASLSQSWRQTEKQNKLTRQTMAEALEPVSQPTTR